MKTVNLLKSTGLFILVFAFAFVLSFSLKASKAFAADSSVAATARTINVTGDGEVTATPDIAYISLGVSTDKPTTVDAQKANSTAMNNVIAAIKNAGIKDADIKTTDYSIYPKYDYDKTSGAGTLVGYTVSNTVNVTVKDISMVGQIIDTAVANGANISSSISFGISDYAKYYNTALLNALSNAKGKADAISNSLGIKLTTPVKITENSNGIPNPYPVIPFSTNTKLDAGNASVTSIQAGTYKVNANVSLVYEY